jgi:hypothetical protein
MASLLILAATAVASEPPAKAEPKGPGIERLIKQLGSDSYAEREAASKALEAAGEVALPALEKAVNHPDIEIRRRAARLREAVRSRLEAEALAAVKRLGGTVEVSANFGEEKSIGVFLSETKVTDADLAHFAWLKELEVLDIRDTDVSDAGLAPLKECRKVWRLWLQGTRVTDMGLIHLKGLSKLANLDLSNTEVTAAGLESLKGLPLRFLQLSGTKITDAGLLCTKDMPLWILNLSKTGVTDAGLGHLKGLEELRVLDLRDTKVTAKGILEFRKSLPDVLILN